MKQVLGIVLIVMVMVSFLDARGIHVKRDSLNSYKSGLNSGYNGAFFIAGNGERDVADKMLKKLGISVSHGNSFAKKPYISGRVHTQKMDKAASSSRGLSFSEMSQVLSSDSQKSSLNTASQAY